ncbi:MAG TPA: DUF4388 domain-containing protein, partial [Vicinamibacteria bacterium]|nr:DUF4388 domain-containing protein [Vicinamibacteria bacterium]
MSKGAELHEAVQELHLYLSDRIAPLMFAYSMEMLLEQPAALLAAEIRTWASQQTASMPDVPFADLLFHAVRKVSGIGEFELVSGERLRAHVKELGQAVLAFCPPEDREILRQNLENLALAPPTAATGPVEILHRPPTAERATGAAAVPKGLSTKVASGLRKLGLFLDRLQAKGVAVAAPEQRAEVASQFMTTAAVQSKNQAELEQHLAPLRQLGIDTAMDKVVIRLAESLPGWGALPSAAGAPAPSAGLEIRAMRQIVSLAEDQAEAAKRFRELVNAAITQFNTGHLGRAVSMFELAEQLVSDKKVESAFVSVLREGGNQYLDAERLKKYGERTDLRSSLRTVMNFFVVLRPEGILRDLNGEARRERRHELLALLEAHGEPARERARHLLAASVAPDANADPYFQMNLVYLLRVIPRPADVSIDEEVNLVMRTAGKEAPPPLVKQAIAYLAATRHDKSERALITYLRVFENMVLQPESAVYSREDVETLLDRTSVALARYATPRAWRALVDHGLKAEATLGTPMARLVEAGRQDLSGSKDLVDRLIAAIRAEHPRAILGFVKKNDDRLGWLIQAISGTPLPEVREALQEMVDKFPGQKFAETAKAALANLGVAAKPPEMPGLAGDLDLFGLPGLLQTLAQSQLTGVLTLMNTDKLAQATVILHGGRFREARHGSLRGVDAMYQLFERPFPGTFAFVSR